VAPFQSQAKVEEFAGDSIGRGVFLFVRGRLANLISNDCVRFFGVNCWLLIDVKAVEA
jgi:hypothetical protein